MHSVLTNRTAHLRYVISEEVPVQTLVGNIISDNNWLKQVRGNVNRTDTGEIHCSWFSSGPTELFKLEAQTGKLYTNTRLDRETLCPTGGSSNRVEKNKCLLEFAAVCRSADSTSENWVSILIEIKDIDDNGPVFLERLSSSGNGAQTFHIGEDVPVGFRHPLPAAYDPDEEINAQISYSLENNSTLSNAVNPFGIEANPASVYLVVKHALDYEKDKMYTLNLRACGRKLTRNKCDILPLHVLVQDVNDNPPVIVYPPKTNHIITVSEATPIGALLIKIEATDADTSEAGRITYSLFDSPRQHLDSVDNGKFLSLSTGNHLSPFKIDPDNGELRLTRMLPANNPTALDTIVLASDNGVPKRTASVRLTIQIADTNNHAPKIEVKRTGCQRTNADPTELTVPFVVESGAHLCLFIVSDADLGQNAQVDCKLQSGDDELESAFNLRFALVSTGLVSGKQLYMLQADRPLTTTGTSPDSLEKKPSVTTLVITCNDHGEPYRLTSSIQLKIKLTDTTEMCFEQTLYQLTLEETAEPINDLVRPQLQEITQRVRYEWKTTPNPASPDESHTASDEGCKQLFVDTATGAIAAPRGLDREIAPLLRCTLQATEINGDRLVFSATTEIHITVTDINDNSPKLTPGLLHKGFSVIEWDSYSEVYTDQLVYPQKIGTITAEDPDAGENGTVVFRLDSVTAERALSSTSSLPSLSPLLEHNADLMEMPLPNFRLDPTTGQVTLPREHHRLIDRELVSAYLLRIALEDCGKVEKRRSLQEIRVNVLDVNDNPPRWHTQSGRQEFIEPVALQPLWTAVPGAVSELITDLKASDADQGENGRLSFAPLGWEKLPKFVTQGRSPLPLRGFHLYDSGRVRLWTSYLSMTQEYVFGVIVHDHGTARKLQTSGYVVVKQSRLIPNVNSTPMSTSSTTNQKRFHFAIENGHGSLPWSTFSPDRFKTIIILLTCLGVVSVAAGAAIIFALSRNRPRNKGQDLQRLQKVTPQLNTRPDDSLMKTHLLDQPPVVALIGGEYFSDVTRNSCDHAAPALVDPTSYSPPLLGDATTPGNCSLSSVPSVLSTAQNLQFSSQWDSKMSYRPTQNDVIRYG
ncbi:protocadherin-9 [Clonorchis sinensis]|uniref:Protocadherin-9 n=1 Tax=Clonorchis sinensis TaxID=79923 RepID=H2KSN3_CLOSI|nr:protocadherin-9 [Clonorchis sinensis]